MMLLLFSGFMSGIFIGSLFSYFKLIFIFAILAGLSFACGFIFKNQKEFFVVFSIAMLGLAIGLFRVDITQNQKSQLQPFLFQKVTAVGIISDEPDKREKDTLLTIRLSQIATSTPISVSEKIITFASVDTPFQYGDKVQMDMTLGVPTEIISNDRSFDYPGYLKVRDISVIGKNPNISLIERNHGSILYGILFKIKNAFVARLNRAIPKPESDLMVGLLIGAKQSLGKVWLAEFQRAGVSHVVVLSGYNIAIVAKSVMAVLGFLSKNLAFGFGALSILLFTLLSGGGASASRAALMVLIALFVQKSGRQYSAAAAFAITLAIMLLWNPLLLVFDPSFQLSALAIVGLIFVAPIIEPYLSFVSQKYGLKEIVSTTIATQIVVLPYLIYTTGIFSLVSLPVNILILGTVPFTMFLGFLTGVFGFLSHALSQIPGFFAYIFLGYQLAVVHLGATLPFGAVNLPAFSPFVLIFVYVIITSVLLRIKKKASTR